MAEQPNGLTITCKNARDLTELRLADITPPALQRAISSLGFELAVEANRWSTGTPVNARLAPNSWLFQHGPTPKELSERLVQIPHHAHDLAQALTTWTLSGHRLQTILSLGCGLDLREAKFPQGSVTRTIFASVPAILSRDPNADHITLHADRSFMHYINNWLDDARGSP